MRARLRVKAPLAEATPHRAEFQSQSSPLLPPELAQTYKLLDAAYRAGQNLFAFYNCGDLSGASQPHKHIQFLPLPSDEVGPPIERLARDVQLEQPGTYSRWTPP